MNSAGRMAATGILELALTLAGCAGSNPPQGPVAGQGGGAAASAKDSLPPGFNDQGNSDLGFLHFAFTEPVQGKTPETLPKNLEEAATRINAIDWRIYERVKAGQYVILWGSPFTAPVTAYEKDAPTKGGWVLRGRGTTEKLTAEQVKQLLGQSGG